MSYAQRIKNHLADYKLQRLGIEENGAWKKNNVKYPYILPSQLEKLNILETIRKEFWDHWKKQASIKLHKDFHHLNSSQAMCFNLLLPMLKGRCDGAAQRVLLEEIGLADEKIERCEFERIIEVSEETNIDFSMILESKVEVIFEIKLSEDEFGTARNDKKHLKKLNDIYKPILTGKVNDDSLKPTNFFANYQLMRYAYYANDKRIVVFIYPRENTSLERGRNYLASVLKPAYRQYVKFIYLEDLVSSLCSLNGGESALCKVHYDLFKEKYIIENIERTFGGDEL